MIDLTSAMRVLEECTRLVKELHGNPLDERTAVVDQTKGRGRTQRAQLSQDLQLLASKLELAAALVRIEYWHARGEADPLRPTREQEIV